MLIVLDEISSDRRRCVASDLKWRADSNEVSLCEPFAWSLELQGIFAPRVSAVRLGELPNSRDMHGGMSNQYRLVELGNSQLLAGLSELVRQSSELSAHLLAHLVELEERKLHLELGFSSLFAYCVEALGMSEGSAGRRIAATRVCGRFPEAFERIARGELHLCARCALAPHLNEENAAGLFDACQRKTR